MTIRVYLSKRWVVISSSFSELITTQLREFHMVSPQVVFILLQATITVAIGSVYGSTVWVKSQLSLKLDCGSDENQIVFSIRSD